ncbi:MAG: PsbP-related protein [Methanobacterium sp.]
MNKNTAIFIPIVLLLILIPVYSGYDAINSNNTNIKSYSQNGISFDYPQNWQQLNQIESSNALVGFGDPDSTNQSTGNINTIVIIQKAPMPAGSKLKQVYDSNYAQTAVQDTSFKTISENLKEVNGTLAYVNTHMVSVNGVLKQEKAVWLQKKGYVYVILFGALPNTFDAQNANFDMIINSFQVK